MATQKNRTGEDQKWWRKLIRGGTFGLAAAQVVFQFSCAPSYHFERVEAYPGGLQIDELASAYLNKEKPSHVTLNVEAPYEQTWDAARKVAHQLKQIDSASESTVTIDSDSGRIHIEQVHIPEEVAAVRAAGGPYPKNEVTYRLREWVSEFYIELTKVSPTNTKVTVSRDVLGVPSMRICAGTLGACRGMYEPEISNGRVENWVLTQLQDLLKGGAQ